VNQDPIGLNGGENLYRFAPNTQSCVDLKPEEHYSLACSQHNYLSVLAVEGVQTIILGDEPLPTFAVHKLDTGISLLNV